MAIVIEEEKRSGGLFTAFVWLVFLALVGSGLYYIFFKKPELIDVVAPGSFKNTEEISRITLDPAQVIDDPHFQALRERVSPSPPALPSGRQNPFLGF